MRDKAYRLYKALGSYRKVSKILFGTETKHEIVRRLIKGITEGSTKKQLEIPKELKEKINLLLLTPIEKKGKTDFMSFSQIFNTLEMDFNKLGFKRKQNSNTPTTKFYEFMKQYIKEEFGSMERLEQKRRNKKEKPKHNLSKHSLKRSLGSWEIDATGYTHNGKTYVIVQVLDRLSMFMFKPLVFEVKEDKKNKYYNKAVNQTILGQYLMNLFIEYGIPEELISDKDKTIASKYIQQALKTLNIKQIKKWKPNQKLIERAFRNIKDEVKAIIVAGKAQKTDFKQIWTTATKFYNEKPHKFTHIKELVIPAKLIDELGYGTIKVDEEIIRKAFSEKVEVSVVNNRIRLDGDIYEFLYEQFDINSPLGRKKQNPRVLVERDIENTTKLYVYSLEGEFLGVANIVTKTLSEITAEHKEKKQSIKRLNKKAEKLKQEAEKIKQEKQKIQNSNLKETETDIFQELQEIETKEESNTKQEEELIKDIFDINNLL